MRVRCLCTSAALYATRKSPQQCCFLDAIHALEIANQQGSSFPRKLFSSLLQWCIDKRTVRLGRKLHCSIVRRQVECDAILASLMVRMYSACSNLRDADKVFNSLTNPDIYNWSGIILAHANAGQGSKAIELYKLMLQQQRLRPDAHIFVAVLKACSAEAALCQGKLVHAYILESSVELLLHVGNILIDMYVSCSCLDDAHAVFHRLPKRDVVTWNTLIAGYSCNGRSDKAFELCQRMQEKGTEPDNVTVLSLLAATSARSKGNVSISCTENLELDAISGKLEFASKLFDKLPMRSLAAWSALIAAYAEHGDEVKAISLYLMLLKEGLKPDIVTFICALKACSDLDMGKCIHFHIIESYCELDLQVRNCLIDIYGQHGALDDARMLFDRMRYQCVVTWSSMLSAYVNNGKYQLSLELFNKMLQGDTKPNDVTYFCAMRSCASMTAQILGLLVYAHAVDTGWDLHMEVNNAAIDMFAKCGSLPDACSVFCSMKECSVVTWSALVSAYAQHNEHKLALECFNDMVQEGIKPNAVTYVCLLSACYHLGLVTEGSHHLYCMQKNHGIKLTVEHRNCLVELLGRTGQLKEAADLLQGMPGVLDIVAWTSLLSQCKTHGNLQLAKECFASISMQEARGTPLQVDL